MCLEFFCAFVAGLAPFKCLGLHGVSCAVSEFLGFQKGIAFPGTAETTHFLFVVPDHTDLPSGSYIAKSYKAFANKYNSAMASENHKPTVNIRTVTGIKGRVVSILKRSPEPAIALSAVFEGLGYTGVTGIGWGVLAGFIVSVAMELGYDVREIGGRYILFRTRGGEEKTASTDHEAELASQYAKKAQNEIEPNWGSGEGKIVNPSTPMSTALVSASKRGHQTSKASNST
jgi:hypothetical protein